MKILSVVLVVLVALEHLYFLYLEMFQWTSPQGRAAFGTTREQAEASKALAANQGLYNGFLSAGLIWGLLHPSAACGVQIQVFFLLCVVVAAIFGAATASRKILWIQGLPAALALASLAALHYFGAVG
ncbi:MAG: DUF1304 domain-containing protein [Acidobacteriota bacterium]